MSQKLYVGNLSYGTSEAQVRDLFAQVGDVKAVTLITDRETGRAKGFGFVEMHSTEQAQEAIKRFNSYTLDDRSLTVNEAHPREERSGSFGGNFGGDRRENRSFGNHSNSGYSGNRKRF